MSKKHDYTVEVVNKPTREESAKKIKELCEFMHENSNQIFKDDRENDLYHKPSGPPY